MNQIEKEVYQLFETNEFKKALLGEDGFFWRDHTWGDHDTMSVFFCFFEWLETKENTFLPIQVMKDTIKEVFIDLKDINKIDNGLVSIHVLRTYCIAAKEDKQWPIDPEFFISLIADNIGQFSKEEIEQLNIRRDIDLLRDYLPGLPPNEELYS